MNGYSKKRIYAIILIAIIALITVACQSNSGVGVVNDNFSVKTVSYGTYAQDVVSDATLVAELEGQNWGSKARITYNGMEYERLIPTPYNSSAKFSDGSAIKPVGNATYCYFTVMPIEWYVLENTTTSLLFAKNILDTSVFNTNSEADTDLEFDGDLVGDLMGEVVYPNEWKHSTIREWLNVEFFNNSFNDIEKTAILEHRSVSNDTVTFGADSAFGCKALACDDYRNHTVAYEDSLDKVFCLSYADTVNTAYGFTSNATAYDCLRMAEPTDYAIAKGAKMYSSTATEGTVDYERDQVWDRNGEYWLRTAGRDVDYAATVRYTGETGLPCQFVNPEADNGKTDKKERNVSVGVRPAIVIGFVV